MAMSCYANWLELDQLNSDLSFLVQPQSELIQQQNQQVMSSDQFLEFDYNYVFSDPDMYPVMMDDSQEFFHSENFNSSSYMDPTTTTTNYPDIYPAPEYKLICPHESKRHKPTTTTTYDNDYIFSTLPSSCFVSQAEFLAPFSHGYLEDTVTATTKKQQQQPPNGGGGSLSAQSVAARVRRRKITEKTQELGKHIPGGQKMNTAEMLHAAFKYIKFLQAQVLILQNLPLPIQENEETLKNEEVLHALLNSSLIQEKLYSAEKCLVPTKYVEIYDSIPVKEEVNKLLLQ